jgi:indolepyruvate ferredoxin oxidoreductase beta subunit
MKPTIRLVIVAVGGQGNLLASRVLGEAALAAGIPFRMSEIHGMAQRGGVVESALVFGAARSPIVSDGEADLLLGFEPAETLRAIARCHAGAIVVTNTAPLPPFTVAIGRGSYPEVPSMLALIRGKIARLTAIDGLALARQAGNAMALNMVMIGALARTGALPFGVEDLKTAIRTKTRTAFVAANLAAFALGFQSAGADG